MQALAVKGSTLGEHYFNVDRRGIITHEIVLELPFSLPEDSFWGTSNAVDWALVQVDKYIRETDSIKKREEASKRFASMGEDRALFEKSLWELPIQPIGGHAFAMPRSIDLAQLPIPGSYLTPGTDVWIAISPRTHNSVSPSWRPELFFILKTKIQRVSFKHNSVWYDFLHLTWYSPNTKNVHASLEAAKVDLAEIISALVPATPDPERFMVHTGEEGEIWGRLSTEEMAKRRQLNAEEI